MPHAIINVSDPIMAANLGASEEIGEALWVSSVVAAMAATRCANPVVSIIGAEKAGADVAAALASMLDPRRNHSWREDRLGALVDLGEVTWIVQCRDPGALPAGVAEHVTAVPMIGAEIRPDSLAGPSLLHEVLDDLGLEFGAEGLTWERVRAALGDWEWNAMGVFYADMRSAVVESVYQAAVGAEAVNQKDHSRHAHPSDPWRPTFNR